MGGGDTIKRLKVSLRILLCSLLLMNIVQTFLPVERASAYPGGVLTGLTAYFGSSITDRASTRPGLIDNDESTFVGVTGSNKYLWVKLRETDNIGAYQFLATATNAKDVLQIRFYDESDGLITQIDSPNVNGVKTEITPVRNVSKVAIYNKSSATINPINELDIFSTDLTPPPVPYGLTYVPNNHIVTLSWAAIAGVPDLAGYNVYKDGVKLNTSLIKTNSYKVTGLINGISNAYTVTSIDYSGNESEKSDVLMAAAVDNEPPPIPSGLYAIPDSNLIQLYWSPVDDWEGDLAGYYLYMDGKRVNTTPLIIQNTFYNYGTLGDIEHEFQISSIDFSGNESGKSKPIKASAYLPPVVPNVTASSTYDSVSLFWDNTGGSYEVWTTDGTTHVLATTTNRFHVIDGLAYDKDYHFYVVAIDKYGRRVASEPVTVRTQPLPSPILPVLKASEITENSFILSWNETGISYEVFRLEKNAFISIGTTGETSLIVNGLNPSMEYVLKVVATDRFNRLVSSNPITVMTHGPPVPPVLSLIKKTFDTVHLSWDNAGLSNEVYRGTELIGITDRGYYEIKDLTYETSYEFKVIAIDSFSRRVESNVLNVTTDGLPPPYIPVLSYQSLTSNSVRLMWTETGTQYEVYQDGNLIRTATNLFLQLYELSPSKSYTFKVIATDIYGRKNESNHLMLTTLPEPEKPPDPVPKPPPPVSNSDNEDLNKPNDYLVQGIKELKDNGIIIILLIILIFVIVFGSMWLAKLARKKMFKAAAISKAVDKKPETTSSSIGTVEIIQPRRTQITSGSTARPNINAPYAVEQQKNYSKGSKKHYGKPSSFRRSKYNPRY